MPKRPPQKKPNAAYLHALRAMRVRVSDLEHELLKLKMCTLQPAHPAGIQYKIALRQGQPMSKDKGRLEDASARGFVPYALFDKDSQRD